MTSFSLDDLKGAMRECAGEDDEFDLSGDVEDTPFDDLGLDSLAVLELTALVSRRLGVSLPEDDMAAVATPAQFLAEVRSRLVAPAA